MLSKLIWIVQHQELIRTNIPLQAWHQNASNIQHGLSATSTALDKTVGAVGLGLAKKTGELLGVTGGDDGSDDSSAAPQREAPGGSESIGGGGQGGMKGASMEGVKKTTAGAGGKRRLRKVSKSGAKV